MSGPVRDHRRVCTTVPGHEPVVTAAPTLATSKQGARGVPHTTMLRCTCGWHGGQVSTLSPGNGGRARPAMQAHKRHMGNVLAGVDDRPGVPWWLTVQQAVAEAGRLKETA